MSKRLSSSPPVPLPGQRWRRVALLGLALALLLTGTASALGVYGPARAVGGPGGCLRDAARQAAADLRCPGSAQGLGGVQALALSPDGRDLYAAAPASDAVVTLARDPGSGALHPPLRPSSRDCVQAPARGRCTITDSALSGADAVVVSPDGRFVYVGASDSATVSGWRRQGGGLLRPLARTLRSAPLRQRHGRNHRPAAGPLYGCVQGNLLPGLPIACVGRQLGLSGVSALALSPDGRYLYAVSSGTVSGEDSIVTLARDPRSGGLAPLSTGGCIESRPGVSCARSSSGLEGAASILVSPDGRYVYVASQLSAQVLAFRRNRLTGVLTRLTEAGGCVSDSDGAHTLQDSPCVVTAGPLGGARALALAPDGSELLVVASDPGSVIALRRDPASGLLGALATPPLCLQALADAACPVAVPALRGASAVGLSRSGRVLYVAATGANSLVEMLRDPLSGRLTLASSDASVVSQANGPTALTLPGSGRGLYLAFPFEDAIGALTE